MDMQKYIDAAEEYVGTLSLQMKMMDFNEENVPTSEQLFTYLVACVLEAGAKHGVYSKHGEIFLPGVAKPVDVHMVIRFLSSLVTTYKGVIIREHRRTLDRLSRPQD